MKIKGAFLAAILTAVLCDSGSTFGYVYNGYDYLLTTNTYAPTANWAEAAVSEFGATAQVVDWNTIKAEFGGSVDSLRSFLDGLGVMDVYNAPAVTWNGSQIWSGTRSHGINRAEGNVPSGYLIHDQILNNWLLLGSWPADRQLVVSIPVPDVNVPNIIGMTQANAQLAITSAGLAVGSVTTAYSNSVAAGNVISQSPIAGTTVAPNTTVNIVVSLGAFIVNLNGQYWFGSLAADVTTNVPWGKQGTVTIAGSNWSQEWDDYDGHHAFSSAFTTTVQPDGSININFPTETYNVAWNGDVMIHADTVPDADNRLGFDILTRKAADVIADEVIGGYSYFGHWLNWDNRGDDDGWGEIIFDSNGTANILYAEDDGELCNESVQWILDAANAAINIDGEMPFYIGENGVLTRFYPEPVGDDYGIEVGYNFAVKKTAQTITMAEMAGTYQVRFLETVPGGVPYTCGQGTCRIDADGTMHVDAWYSDGEHDVFDSTYSVGPGNVFNFDGGHMTEGIISLDKNLIFIPEYQYENSAGRTDDDWLGGIFLVRQFEDSGPNNYSGGDGSAGNPYQIANVADFLQLSATPTDWSKSFILTTDIDFGQQVFTMAIIAPDPIAGNGIFEGTAFTGTFDGHGNKITHLTINGGSNSYLGLFGYVSGGSVNNLSLVNFTVSGHEYVGGLVGVNVWGSISNCDSTGTVSGDYTDQLGLVGGLAGANYGSINNCFSMGVISGFGYVGGLVGNNGGSISNCYSTGTVSGDYWGVGGLAGGNNGGNISNCYATGQVSVPSNGGGLLGYNSGSISNCYSTGIVSGSEYIGGFCGYDDWGSISNSFWDMESSETTDGVGNMNSDPSGVIGKTTPEMQTQSTFIDAEWDFSNTDGDIADWIMSGYPRLLWEITLVVPDVVGQTQMNAEMTLTGVGLLITITNAASDSTPAGQVISQSLAAGTEVQGGSIVNLVISLGPKYSGDGTAQNPYKITSKYDLLILAATPTDYDKYFILTADIDLIGLTFANSPIAPDTSADWAFQGTLFTGVFEGDGHTISNLTITAPTKNYIGLFGVVSGGQIRNLGVMNAAIEGDAPVGGLVGMNQGTLTACYMTGSVTGYSFVGGLVGQNNGSLTSCYATGSVTGGDTVGGLAGYNWDGTIIFCYATGSVSGNSYVGGLVGKNYYGASSITACYASGSVSGTGNGVGGLAGDNVEGSINSCFWDIQASGMTDGVGNVDPDPTGAIGMTTPEMQTQSIFTDAGWDFDTPVWMITGQDYPRLIWSDPDMDNNGKVNFADFSILANQWMESECGFCDDADLTGDRGVNLHDLLVFAAHWLEEDKIANHIFKIEMSTEWDYEYPDSGDDEYVIGVEVHTDDMVERIEFTTPAGNTFEIPNTPVTEYPIAEGYMEIGREFDNETGRYLWIYAPGFVSPDSLSAYGDGLYTFTMYYTDGYSHQTTAWFGIPGTNDPVPQPTQIPIFTSFSNGDTLTSPVTFAWQPCTDSAAETVWLGVYSDDNEMEWELPVTATGLDEPLDLPDGWHEAELGFEVWYLSQNSDDIIIDVGKYSECDYMMTVESAPTPVPGRLLWQAVKAPYANGSMYYAIQPRITISDMKACSLKGPNMADFSPAQWVPQRGQWTLAIVPLTLSQLQQKSLGTWQLKLTDMNDNESIYSFTISGALQDSEFLPMPVMIEPYFGDSNVIAEHYTLRWDPNGAQADADALGVEITGSGFSYFSNTLDLSVTSWDPGWLEIGSAYCKVGYADYRQDMVNTPSLVSGPKINWESTMASVVSGPYCPFTVKYSLDFNDDDVIDVSDLAALTSYWLESAPSSADLDDDGIVNLPDFVIFAQHWLEEI